MISPLLIGSCLAGCTFSGAVTPSVQVAAAPVIAGTALVADPTKADLPIFTNGYQGDWHYWGWGTVADEAPAGESSSGSTIKVTLTKWQAVHFHHEAVPLSGYDALVFRIHGGSQGGQKLKVQAIVGGKPLDERFDVPTPAANSWAEVRVPLKTLGAAGRADITGFWIQDASGEGAAPFYLANIRLTAGSGEASSNSPATAAESAAAEPLAVHVDLGRDRHPISPLIYGANFASPDQVKQLRLTVNRYGGNTTSRYNWKINAANAGKDWYYLSHAGVGALGIGVEPSPIDDAEGSTTPSASVDAFVQGNSKAGSQTMVTVPVLHWVAKLGAADAALGSFPVSKYGAQQSVAPSFEAFGNGIRKDGSLITGNDPSDANVPAGTQYQRGWIEHLTGAFGPRAKGGVGYYILDNEPGIWQDTHRDVKPEGFKMDDFFAQERDMAAMIKSVDPTAQIAAPEEWGWNGYLYSGYDVQWAAKNGWDKPKPDRAAHGDMDMAPWYLKQFAQQEKRTGHRLLDVFTLHWYPQNNENSDDVSEAMQVRRVESTRSLWDPTYKDDSWVNTNVQLIPRMKQWVSQYYPGTKIGITEYSWGADKDISGALAQAEILGVFGREGLDLATRWCCPHTDTLVYNAFRMYRNTDGTGGGFGDESVHSDSTDTEHLSSYASVDSKSGSVTVMLLNKRLHQAQPVNLSIAGLASGAISGCQLTAANQITKLTGIEKTGTGIQITLPAQSITLLRIASAGK